MLSDYPPKQWINFEYLELGFGVCCGIGILAVAIFNEFYADIHSNSILTSSPEQNEQQSQPAAHTVNEPIIQIDVHHDAVLTSSPERNDQQLEPAVHTIDEPIIRNDENGPHPDVSNTVIAADLFSSEETNSTASATEDVNSLNDKMHSTESAVILFGRLKQLKVDNDKILILYNPISSEEISTPGSAIEKFISSTTNIQSTKRNLDELRGETYRMKPPAEDAISSKVSSVERECRELRDKYVKLKTQYKIMERDIKNTISVEINRINASRTGPSMYVHHDEVNRPPMVIKHEHNYNYYKPRHAIRDDTDSGVSLENICRSDDRQNTSTSSGYLSIPTVAPTPPPLPPPPPPPPQSSPQIYQRIPITMSLLKTVRLQSINEDPKKIKKPDGMRTLTRAVGPLFA